MEIGLYNEPTNTKLSNYKGLYRQCDLMNFYECDNVYLKEIIDKYFSLLKDKNYLDCTENTYTISLQLYRTIKTFGWNGDLIIFTDKISENIPNNFDFIGYDICADSKYYSPLGDNFLDRYILDSKFFSSMNNDSFKKYKKNINSSGLFDDYSIALDFAQYCNIINKKYEHVIESEDNWRPFAIYMLKLI